MKLITKAIFCSLMFITGTASADFLHPLDFDDSDAQKEKVVSIIKESTRQTYCKSGVDLCQASTLRMMENNEMKAFKKLTTATDRKLMDQVIATYCKGPVDMCNYSTISMMYNSEMKASQKELTW